MSCMNWLLDLLHPESFLSWCPVHSLDQDCEVSDTSQPIGLEDSGTKSDDAFKYNNIE